MATAEVIDSIQNTRTLELAHTAAVVIREVIVSNDQVLIAVNAADADDANAYICRAKVRFPKEASLEVSVGDRLYWDVTNGVATKTPSGNTFIGIAIEAALAADTEVIAILFENRFAQQAALSLKNTDTVAATYSTLEQGVVQNNRTRIDEIETVLKILGFLASP